MRSSRDHLRRVLAWSVERGRGRSGVGVGGSSSDPCYAISAQGSALLDCGRLRVSSRVQQQPMRFPDENLRRKLFRVHCCCLRVHVIIHRGRPVPALSARGSLREQRARRPRLRGLGHGKGPSSGSIGRRGSIGSRLASRSNDSGTLCCAGRAAPRIELRGGICRQEAAAVRAPIVREILQRPRRSSVPLVVRRQHHVARAGRTLGIESGLQPSPTRSASASASASSSPRLRAPPPAIHALCCAAARASHLVSFLVDSAASWSKETILGASHLGATLVTLVVIVGTLLAVGQL